jgi:hypothetical protein
MNGDRRDDVELVAAVLAGDREAFGPLLIRMGRVPQPTQAQVHTFTTLTWGLLLLDALLGVAVLRGRWRQALVPERVQPAPQRTLDARPVPIADRAGSRWLAPAGLAIAVSASSRRGERRGREDRSRPASPSTCSPPPGPQAPPEPIYTPRRFAQGPA